MPTDLDPYAPHQRAMTGQMRPGRMADMPVADLLAAYASEAAGMTTATVPEILDWVGCNVLRARAITELEEAARRPRTGMLRTLEAIAGG